MKIQLVGGPCDGAWADAREGQRTLTIGHVGSHRVAPRGFEISEEAYTEYTYRLTAHDNNTQTFEYQG